jgi:transposase
MNWCAGGWRRPGEIREAVLFVAVLGASNYTYAELQGAPDLPSWIDGHARVLEYFGGVRAPAVVCQSVRANP